MSPAKTPQGTRQRRGAAAREALLDVACDLFRDRGVNTVGIDEIVASAGMAKSTLYRWFPAKDDLIVAFLRRRDELFWQQWERVAGEWATDADAELDAHLSWILIYIRTPEFRGCPFLNTTAEIADRNHPSGQVVRENKARLRNELVRLCERLGVGDPASLADQLQLAIEGAFAISPVFGEGGPHDQLVATGQALVNAARG